MKKFKNSKLIALTAFMLFGANYAAQANYNNKIVTKAEANDVVTISNKEDLLKFFDGSANSCNKDAILTEDIDLEGKVFVNVAMAGEYNGNFDGGGAYNF